MGISVEGGKLGLAVLDPWEIRGAIDFSTREPLQYLKLKIFSFIAQEKPSAAVLVEDGLGKRTKLGKFIHGLLSRRGLDLSRIKVKEIEAHFGSLRPEVLRGRLRTLFGTSADEFKAAAAIFAAAGAVTHLHLKDFPSRTYVKPHPRKISPHTQSSRRA